ELSTAWAEYNQGFVQHPALIAQLSLAHARLADLANPAQVAGVGVGAAIHRCEWREAMERGEVPETHRLRERLIAEGFHGVVYPSFMSPGGRCVALWVWSTDNGPVLTVI